MEQKFILINQLSPIMEENKSAIVGLDKYFSKSISIPAYMFKMLKQLEFMIIDEDETELFPFFDYPIQISVHTSDDQYLYCMLEDVNCFE